ncbi:hypothetical protein JOC95_003527 [Bacillus tianshenii]|uniref:Uncharacterized protein n=1 Tax=Sutcliffiella tianshenii TaxID=1463404 RepID=A0ABS2P4K1_9BACI|nr:hypothetical protein [Bacillus tianshenii]
MQWFFPNGLNYFYAGGGGNRLELLGEGLHICPFYG